MDRQTLAQAVAMLVMLAALLRWLPPASDKDPLGRGDPWRAIRDDAMLTREAYGGDAGRAWMLGSWMGGKDYAKRKFYTKRYHQVFKLLRDLPASAARDAVIDLQSFSRNERWLLTYMLYPMRVAARGEEAGPPASSASWALTSGGQSGIPSLRRVEVAK